MAYGDKVKKYNQQGGLNAVWVYYEKLKHEEEERRRLYEDQSYNTGEGITINAMIDDDEEDLEKKYEAAFAFLKQHSRGKSDEEIALEVLERLG